jgi:hypothetical protein
MIRSRVIPTHHLMIMVSSAASVRVYRGASPLGSYPTLSKGYDLDYIWGQVVRGLARVWCVVSGDA